MELIKEEAVNQTNQTTNEIEVNPETSLQKRETTRQEYQTMPQTLKSYKVIRKNNNSKIEFRYLYFRGNFNKIAKGICYQTLWSIH